MDNENNDEIYNKSTIDKKIEHEEKVIVEIHKQLEVSQGQIYSPFNEFKTENITVAIYARVSPTKHLKDENDLHESLAESIRMCKLKAEKENNQIYKVYSDQYISGSDHSKLPAFQEMMKDAREGKFTRIYSRRSNRFGRNYYGTMEHAIELSKMGITLLFLEPPCDTASPLGHVFLSFQALKDEYDRLEILRNTARGRKKALENGVKFGRKSIEINVRSAWLIRNDNLKMPRNKRESMDDTAKQFNLSKPSLIKRFKESGYWHMEYNRLIIESEIHLKEEMKKRYFESIKKTGD
jgi:DNA invertase Pin-like site-specific DNA recombinase